MAERVRVIGGPIDGEMMAPPSGRHMSLIPLDRQLNPIHGQEKPYAFAVYEYDDSGSEPVFRFHSAQREGADKGGDNTFEVEFIDGPMKGVRQFRQAIQLYDKTFRFPLDSEGQELRKGIKVGRIAEYKRKLVDGAWKMSLVQIVDSDSETEQFSDSIAESTRLDELESYTAKQLIDALLRRPHFLGLVLYCSTESTGEVHMQKGEEIAMGLSRKLDKNGAIVLLRSALDSLDRKRKH